MPEISGKHTSYWIDSTENLAIAPFIDNVAVDVVIVGAGLAGITAATLLKRAGKTVAVVDMRRVAWSTSGHTTAKISSLHRLVYAQLIDQMGEEKARLYGEANEAAIAQIASLVEQDNIDCDFKRTSAYTFAEYEQDLGKVKDEAEAAIALGLPASFVSEASLPFPIAGAVKFDNQAQFHVRKYILNLASKIAGDGSYLFEETRVTGVEEGDPCTVKTDKGILRGKDVIVATNLPILDWGFHFAKSYPKRSYLVAAAIAPDKAPDGVFIGANENYRSIRNTPYNGGTLLLIGGEGHKTGTEQDIAARYRRLEDYGRERFGIESYAYRWSTQDMESFDKVPYIGKITPANNHIYVATGFSLWGMTNTTVSGMLLCDLILGRDNPWAEVFDSNRATPFVSQTSLKQNLDVGVRWLGDRVKALGSNSFDTVQRGEGKLVTVNGNQVAAYREEGGMVKAVSAVCTHLGCVVNWNPGEKSWDCPCHGARFDPDGKLLRGPAIEDLEKLDL